MSISVIIPTLNEAATIGKVLSSMAPESAAEIIVVDGGSSDGTAAIVQQSGAALLSSKPGRAAQLNQGAAHASGDILLFLHADTFLPVGFDRLIRDALLEPGVAGGAFSLSLENANLPLKIIAFSANLRSHFLQLPYGDQALFTTKTVFEKTGGFPDLPIMEDYQFVDNLRKYGKIVTLQQCVISSARRWQNMGILRTTIINQLIVLGYHLGVPPTRLSRLYKRAKGVRSTDHA